MGCRGAAMPASPEWNLSTPRDISEVPVSMMGTDDSATNATTMTTARIAAVIDATQMLRKTAGADFASPSSSSNDTSKKSSGREMVRKVWDHLLPSGSGLTQYEPSAVVVCSANGPVIVGRRLPNKAAVDEGP